ncbi:FAD:protein FMN transferase [Candidatus Magnetomonas plexicatena]|uniref:FAD:protein FMN transferase n=1 Tax=Candidatus Magnetomonas plexicatena TaxID=2552947 RepID=UPI001C752933|nr:FAD:protein FMN transferase [Nitrospirales bacterium LBB_01]
MKLVLKILLALLATTALAALFVFVKQKYHSGAQVYKKTKIAMDTAITITVVSDSQEKAEKAIDTAFRKIDYYDHQFSFFLPDSDISLINKNAGIKPVRVSKDTFELVKKTVEISELTGGAFDASVGAFMVLWDFAKAVKPSDDELKKRIPLVNYKNIEVNEADSSVMLKQKGMMLDFGGNAKGYTADKIVELLKSMGIRSGIAAIAGDIKTFGSKLDGSPWFIGIRNPRGTPSDLVGILKLKDQAVSTAGDYERFFIENGHRYHHILMPQTGLPAPEFQSVTIVNPEGFVTDSLDNAVFVMGKEKGLEFIKKHNLKAFLIFSDNTTYITDNLKEEFEQENSH